MELANRRFSSCVLKVLVSSWTTMLRWEVRSVGRVGMVLLRSVFASMGCRVVERWRGGNSSGAWLRLRSMKTDFLRCCCS